MSTSESRTKPEPISEQARSFRYPPRIPSSLMVGGPITAAAAVAGVVVLAALTSWWVLFALFALPPDDAGLAAGHDDRDARQYGERLLGMVSAVAQIRGRPNGVGRVRERALRWPRASNRRSASSQNSASELLDARVGQLLHSRSPQR